jgi:threonine dehydratase
LAPVGGGGLLSETALATSIYSTKTKVIATEPAQADDAWKSFKSKKIIPSINPTTIADGLRTSLGTWTFPIILRYVDEILTVSEANIIKSMRLVWERMKIIIEPSSAVPVAAVIQYPEIFRHKTIGIIISGGNVDFDHLPWEIN